MLLTKAVEKIITHLMFSKVFTKIMPFMITWKNVVERGRPHITIWRLHIACWIPKGTNTHTEYVVLIAFPLQQWLEKCFNVTLYVHCLSCCWI